MSTLPRFHPTRGLLLGLAALLSVATVGLAQAPAPDVRRAQATREELKAGLKELEEIINSPGYSKSFRKSREAEVGLVQARLADGDFQVGDQIDIMVVGEGSLSGKFAVLPGRVLSLPLLAPVSVQGILRSEVRDHLTTEIGKYVKNPQVIVQGSYIRLAIFGSTGNGGYFTLPADALLSDALMQASMPRSSEDMEKSLVRRQGREVIAGTELQRAVETGQSLDQLNLHGGDELIIGTSAKSTGPGASGGSGWRNYFWPIQAISTLSFLLIRIF